MMPFDRNKREDAENIYRKKDPIDPDPTMLCWFPIKKQEEESG
jgi:hypothetical protein